MAMRTFLLMMLLLLLLLLLLKLAMDVCQSCGLFVLFLVVFGTLRDALTVSISGGQEEVICDETMGHR